MKKLIIFIPILLTGCLSNQKQFDEINKTLFVINQKVDVSAKLLNDTNVFVDKMAQQTLSPADYTKGKKEQSTNWNNLITMWNKQREDDEKRRGDERKSNQDKHDFLVLILQIIGALIGIPFLGKGIGLGTKMIKTVKKNAQT